jgi:hypothetical protein
MYTGQWWLWIELRLRRLGWEWNVASMDETEKTYKLCVGNNRLVHTHSHNCHHTLQFLINITQTNHWTASMKYVYASCTSPLINPKSHVTTATVFDNAINGHISIVLSPVSKCHVRVSHWRNKCSCMTPMWLQISGRYSPTEKNYPCNRK